MISEYFFSEFEEDLIENVTSKFWSYFSSPIEDDIFSHVCTAFTLLHQHYYSYDESFRCLENIRSILSECEDFNTDNSNFVITSSLKEHAQIYIKAIVFRNTTPHFQRTILDFYSQAFQAFDPSSNANKGMSVIQINFNDLIIHIEYI